MKKFGILNQLFVALFLLIVGSCQTDDEDAIYSVQEEFAPFVAKFLEEAQLRGHSITITNLIMKFGETEKETYCGECQSVPDKPNVQRRIIISTTAACWSAASAEEKEALVFHELGHCVLNRLGHKEDRLPNGDLASIMNLGRLELYESCTYDLGGGDCDKRYRRTYYIDELFDEDAPVPDWAK